MTSVLLAKIMTALDHCTKNANMHIMDVKTHNDKYRGAKTVLVVSGCHIPDVHVLAGACCASCDTAKLILLSLAGSARFVLS